MTKIPVWLDCDPGVDDAMALALLLRCPEYQLMGVSAVAGNVEEEKTFSNARNLMHFFGGTAPVYPGAKKPLFREPRTAYFVHGENGLGNVTLPESPQKVQTLPASDAIYEAAKAADGELVLIAIGPLTNVALALMKHGSLGKLIKQIVLMGGSASYGNATPAAEANIFCDPEAASLVFQSGIPIVMCGLDMTLKAIMSPRELDAMAALNPTARFLRDAAQHGLAYSKAHGFDGMALHDPTAVLYPLYPQLFSGEEAGVAVETKGSVTRGKTVTDLYSDKQFPFKNALVMLDVNREGLIAVVMDILNRY